MAGRAVGPVLAEMLEAIAGIEIATAGRSLSDFKQDWLLRMAVQRALEIVSEASRHIPDDLLLAAPGIRWRQNRGIGNILRHEYHQIADEVVWVVVTDDLPPLKSAVVAVQTQVSTAG